MSDIPTFITLEEAIRISTQIKIKQSYEEITLDKAYGRILGKDLTSKVNDPPFDNSAMDGFAMKYYDTTSPPSTLKIIGTIQATGQEDNITVKSGQAVRIMTGAPIPKGADSILQVELTTTKKNLVTLSQEGMKHFIRRKGENLKKGDVALKLGTYLTPSKISLCATMGYSTIPVIRKLNIAIISTGNELKSPGEKLKRGEIYESNSFGLAGLVKWLGHNPVRMNIVGDTIEDLRKILNKASTECDLILTSGGVSMGEWDLVRKIMEEEGNLSFWRIKLRPGSPPLFGTWEKTPIFGLPGNPVSSHIVFRMLVAPWIRNTTSSTEPTEFRTVAKLATNVKNSKDCLTLRRVSLIIEEGELFAHQKIHQGSGNITSMSFSEGLVVLKPNKKYNIGEIVEVIIL
ncbi:MAG: molybdopterin molybdotransferase MoeA [Candidatus Poseidoniaceae archaeon]|jgi:molybdopterin molybdotransferase|nr:molybdopterin molybdotransferase MoeA [Candidatus Poseidoniaceae archaeon]